MSDCGSNPALPALPGWAGGPPLEVCGNCAHCGGEAGRLSCRRDPPQVAAAPVAVPAKIASPGPGVSVQWIVNAFYPPVQENLPACGGFRAKTKLVN
jgi:hypothetical protein